MDNYKYQSLPVFDYQSPLSFGNNNDQDQDHLMNIVDYRRNCFQQIIYLILIIFSTLFLIITFPVSAFFYIKKIDSLQRCLVYRLGQRLPIKGPGFMIRLPFVDEIFIIDLHENRFHLVEQEQQMLTGK